MPFMQEMTHDLVRHGLPVAGALTGAVYATTTRGVQSVVKIAAMTLGGWMAGWVTQRVVFAISEGTETVPPMAGQLSAPRRQPACGSLSECLSRVSNAPDNAYPV